MKKKYVERDNPRVREEERERESNRRENFKQKRNKRNFWINSTEKRFKDTKIEKSDRGREKEREREGVCLIEKERGKEGEREREVKNAVHYKLFIYVMNCFFCKGGPNL